MIRRIVLHTILLLCAMVPATAAYATPFAYGDMNGEVTLLRHNPPDTFIVSKSDSARLLREVSIIRRGVSDAVRFVMPLQRMDCEAMQRVAAFSVGDAMRTMAGATLRDYGGIGGMKTVSVRGLGSSFTTLMLDGIAVGDALNGQPDLGRFMLDGVNAVSFANGQMGEPLLSARALAAGSVIDLETQRPRDSVIHALLALDGGMYGLVSPRLAISRRVSNNIGYSANLSYLRADADYPFVQSIGPDRYEHLYRINNALWQARGEGTIWVDFDAAHQLQGKVLLYESHHHLPGPVVIYRTVAGSEEMWQRQLTAQVRYRARWGDAAKQWALQMVAKMQHGYDCYDDTARHTVNGTLSNHYRQEEQYFAAVLRYNPIGPLSIELSSDGIANQLHSNLQQNGDVQRLSWLSSLRTQWQSDHINIDAHLLATLASEDADDDNRQYRRLSPFVGMSYAPISNGGLRLRYFYKQHYRMPTFSEQYYLPMTRYLLPEKASQHNIGVAYQYSGTSMLHTFTLTADGYYNSVEDKIIAIPTYNMFVWSMVNMGRAEVWGLDLHGNATLQIGGATLDANATYSLQHATDRTDANTKSYGHQLPYTPRHSGSASLYMTMPWVEVGYDIQVVGVRYSLPHNSAASHLDPYSDQGVTLARSFVLRHGTLRMMLRLQNIMDVQYEVVRSYPMMGRHLRGTITYTF